jgi:outer membrane protein OmpA-like peptidoglycan-associated protein
MNRTSVALFAALLLGTLGAGVVAWRHMGDLQIEVVDLRTTVAGLGEELRLAQGRAAAAERRATDAERRAGRAAELADLQTTRARTAETAATSASEQAAAERAAAATERQRAAAAEAAVAEAKRLREEELDRMAETLDKIAETRRTALGLVMNLGDSIEFDTDKAELRPGNREVLARIAGVLMAGSDFGIQVYGHTDDVGNAGYNERLSERRAKAVREYLVASGVAEGAIVAVGMGEKVPLAEGTNETARQRNRRVEIAVVHSEGAARGPVDQESAGR